MRAPLPLSGRVLQQVPLAGFPVSGRVAMDVPETRYWIAATCALITRWPGAVRSIWCSCLVSSRTSMCGGKSLPLPRVLLRFVGNTVRLRYGSVPRRSHRI